MVFNLKMTPKEIVIMVTNVLKIFNGDFVFILVYKTDFVRLCYTIYNKSFEMNKTASVSHVQISIENKLIKEFKKFRKNYEKFRYATWGFLKRHFNLDNNIMFCIDNFL